MHTKEGYVYKITENEIEYLGLSGGEGSKPVPDNFKEGEINFDYEPKKEEWTQGPVTVKISTTLKGYTIQYSLTAEDNDWKDYPSNGIEVTENRAIYARLRNNIGGKMEKYATGSVANIDKLEPNTFEPTVTTTTNSITITGQTTDQGENEQYGSSKVCKYYFAIDGDKWEPEEGFSVTDENQEASHIFEGLEQETSYTLKMKAVDKAGNVIIIEKQAKTQKIVIETAQTLKEKLKDTNGESVIGKKVTGLEEGSTGVANDYEWEIFDVVDDHIYLIATDYIKVEHCPNGKNKSEIIKENDYWAKLDNVVNDYEGSSSITKENIKALNKDFYGNNNYESTDVNMKAVAYMLDTDIWTEKFIGKKEGNDKVEYVIAGPTIEQIFNSYNNKYGTKYSAKVSDVIEEAYPGALRTSIGYKISKTGDDDSYEYAINKMLMKKDGITVDETYAISSTDKAWNMFVASPSANYEDATMMVSFDGNVDNDASVGYNFSKGFRPVICLQSEVKIIEQGDGYEIE